MSRPTLRQGAKGADVITLQTQLSSAGFKCTIDGDFGPLTTKRVKEYQTKFFGASEADGVVGPKTWAKLFGEDPIDDDKTGVKTLTKGQDIQLSKNFHLSEWACKCSRCKTVVVDFNHVNKLQALRDKLGKTIAINSAYRCPAHNAEVGGVPNSEHVQGCATDIDVEGMSPSQVQSKCEFFDGLGYYATFTHVDSRGYYARWQG